MPRMMLSLSHAHPIALLPQDADLSSEYQPHKAQHRVISARRIISHEEGGKTACDRGPHGRGRATNMRKAYMPPVLWGQRGEAAEAVVPRHRRTPLSPWHMK